MEKKLKASNDNRIDYGVILPVFLLCLIGLLSLYVALSHDPNNPAVLKGVGMQVVWYLVGAAAIVVIMHLNSKWIWKLTPYLYGLGLVVMGLLLEFYDKNLADSTGSKNWFRFGAFTFQPAELMKIAYILMMALIVTKHNTQVKERTMKSDFWLIGKLLIVTIPVLALIMAQDDFGTMLVFLAIFGGIFLMSGISWRIIAPVVILAVVVGAGTIFLVTTEGGRD
ncbi:FtsW/RodA/SpoVE family cell cycle protein, partial [Enterococcus lactis]